MSYIYEEDLQQIILDYDYPRDIQIMEFSEDAKNDVLDAMFKHPEACDIIPNSFEPEDYAKFVFDKKGSEHDTVSFVIGDVVLKAHQDDIDEQIEDLEWPLDSETLEAMREDYQESLNDRDRIRL